MENQELLQALGQMMDEKLENALAPIKAQINTMQEDIAEIKEDTAVTRSATNSLVEWADEVSVITQIKFPTQKAK